MTTELRPPKHGKNTVYRNTGAHESERTIVPYVEDVEAGRQKPMISRRFGSAALHEVAEPLAPDHEAESAEDAGHLYDVFHFYTPEEILALRGDVTTDADPGERTRVTVESEQAAVNAFISSSSEVKQIIDEAAKELPFIGRDKMIPGFLRVNDAVRIELGGHFLKTLDDMAGLPDKIYNNWAKLPNAGGYSRMPSREYVAVLALAMLDGTYKENPSMPIMKRPDGTYDDGSYRDTAQKLLRQGSSF